MAEYTYEDIIMDPNDPRLEGAIGKECYVSDFPKIALNNARDNLITDRLKRIAKEETCPFVDEEEEDNWAVIILKKEEPKKYVPFKNGLEFLISYSSYERLLTEENCFLSNHGIWLKAKDADDALFMVTEIWSCGVVFSCDMKTTEELEGEYLTINEPTTWEQLLMLYTFLDGSPCGKLAEEEQ